MLTSPHQCQLQPDILTAQTNLPGQWPPPHRAVVGAADGDPAQPRSHPLHPTCESQRAAEQDLTLINPFCESNHATFR
jgi:hypothetical protein